MGGGHLSCVLEEFCDAQVVVVGVQREHADAAVAAFFATGIREPQGGLVLSGEEVDQLGDLFVGCVERLWLVRSSGRLLVPVRVRVMRECARGHECGRQRGVLVGVGFE